jgi:hypothetical protein
MRPALQRSLCDAAQPPAPQPARRVSADGCSGASRLGRAGALTEHPGLAVPGDLQQRRLRLLAQAGQAAVQRALRIPQVVAQHLCGDLIQSGQRLLGVPQGPLLRNGAHVKQGVAVLKQPGGGWGHHSGGC